MSENRNNDINLLAMKLKTEVVRLKNALSQFETDIGMLETGNDKGPYWNGEGAYNFIKSSTGNIDHNKTLVDNLEKCVEYVDSLV